MVLVKLVLLSHHLLFHFLIILIELLELLARNRWSNFSCLQSLKVDTVEEGMRLESCIVISGAWQAVTQTLQRIQMQELINEVNSISRSALRVNYLTLANLLKDGVVVCSSERPLACDHLVDYYT